jgi:MFS family permease
MRHGARRWMGTITFACGVVGMLHALISSRPGFYVLRCLLGLAEAGGGSSTGHLLAQFYPRDRCVATHEGVYVAGFMTARF